MVQFFWSSLAVLGSVLLLSTTSRAFVENVNHGYPSCMSCHISPSGGGILTDYGRGLSKELMSTFGTEPMTKPLFGLVPDDEHWKVGGDIRYAQTHFENDMIRKGQFFAMQQNAEVAYVQGPVTVVGTIGTQEGPKGMEGKGDFLSERHYVLGAIGDSTFIRAGKFRIPFGVNDPNHTRVTKGKLGFGSNSETYNVESVFLTESSEYFVGANFGKFDGSDAAKMERAIYGNSSWYVTDKSRIGAQAYIAKSERTERILLGANGILSLPLHSILVLEADWQQGITKEPTTSSTTGLYGTGRWNFVVYKGVTPYLITEYAQPDLGEKDQAETRNGLGLQWWPLPHFDLQAEFQKVTAKTPEATMLADSAWLILHLYL